MNLRSIGRRFIFEYFEYLRLLRIDDNLRTREEIRLRQPSRTTTLPSEQDAGMAKETSRLLASRLKKGSPLQLRIVGSKAKPMTMTLPAPAVGLLARILEEMARGNAVTILPVQGEVTTQEAADLLNISRPSLIQLLNEGKIEYRRVGTHRRVRLDMLLKYKRRVDEARRAALDELAAYDQELGV